jgi:hypothetical protein
MANRLTKAFFLISNRGGKKNQGPSFDPLVNSGFANSLYCAHRKMADAIKTGPKSELRLHGEAWTTSDWHC